MSLSLDSVSNTLPAVSGGVNIAIGFGIFLCFYLWKVSRQRITG